MSKKEEKNNDIFFRQKFEFLVQYQVNSKIIKVLKDHFTVREIYVIEEKDESKEEKKI